MASKITPPITPTIIDTKKTPECKNILSKLVAKICSFISGIFSFFASLFSKTEINIPIDQRVIDSEAIVLKLSHEQNPLAKSQTKNKDFDWDANECYSMFTETIQRYVPMRKDNGPIDPAKIIVVCKPGPVGTVYPVR